MTFISQTFLIITCYITTFQTAISVVHSINRTVGTRQRGIDEEQRGQDHTQQRSRHHQRNWAIPDLRSGNNLNY